MVVAGTALTDGGGTDAMSLARFITQRNRTNQYQTTPPGTRRGIPRTHANRNRRRQSRVPSRRPCTTRVPLHAAYAHAAVRAAEHAGTRQHGP
jgi:hypothetical protein